MTLQTVCDRSNRSAQAEVFVPTTEAELIDLLKKFNNQQTPVTIAAGRTALTGSCVPVAGVVVDVMGLDAPLEKASQTQWLLPPSILIENLDAQLAKEGLVYLPTPGYKKCSLGGTVATNASGPRTFSFGATRKHIWSLRVVLIDGEILELKRGAHISTGENFVFTSLGGKTYKVPCPQYTWPKIKNATGLYALLPLDVIDLFIGSEGLLGVITQVGITAYKFNDKIETEAYFFTSEAEALDCAQQLRNYGFDEVKKSGFISVEFMDEGALKLSDSTEFSHYKAAIEIEYFATDEPTVAWWKSAKQRYDILAKLTGEEVPRFRYSIPFNLSEKLRQYGTIKVASDFAVPADNFPTMWKAYKQAMQKFEAAKTTNDVTTAIWGHIGDCHLHLNFIPQSQTQSDLAQVLYLDLAETCVCLGGVLSAEHGVGKKKFTDRRSLLEVQNADMILEIANIKGSLDPQFLLNPNNMIPRKRGKGRKEV